MTMIVLALLGLMVLVVTFAPQQTPVQSEAERTAPAPSATPENLTDPDAFDVRRTLSAAPGAQASTVRAELGDRVEITVEGEGPDSVQLGGLSLQTVEAGDPARFELLAETPGAYPLVLVNENRRIGTLEIR
jgi:hypothetical protein